jgi:hypothetical protein
VVLSILKMYLLLIYISSFEKCLFSTLRKFGCAIELSEVFVYLDVNSLSDVKLVNNFSLRGYFLTYSCLLALGRFNRIIRA